MLDMLNNIYNGQELNISDYDNCSDIKWLTKLNNNNFLDHIPQETLCNSIIIVPTNKIIKDNTNKIRNIINPIDENKKEIEYNGNIYRIGDPVIHCENFKSEKLFNGKTGTVTAIYNLFITVDFYIEKDNEKKYDHNDSYKYYFDKEFIKYLKPAYMITCHKTQGSQYSNIIVYLSSS
jgi:hypothetical protein